MINHILTTNHILFKANIVPSPLCVLCNAERETIIHSIWECQEVQKLLQSFEFHLEALPIPFVITKAIFIFGNLDKSNIYYRVDNEIIIIIKQYIYKTRFLHNSLHISALINTIRDNYTTQRYISRGKGHVTLERFDKDWTKWKRLIVLTE